MFNKKNNCKNNLIISNGVNKDTDILDIIHFGAILGLDSKMGVLFDECDLNLADTRSQFSEEDILKKFDSILSESIERETRGNDKVGLLLSGGIDSANIASYLRKFGKEIYAYTWGGWGINTTDAVYSKFTAEKYGIKNHKIIPHPNDYEEEKELYLKELKKTGLPLSWSDSVPYLYLKQEILKDGVDVVFNGQNADTLFMAYPAPVNVYKMKRILGVAGLGSFFSILWLMRRFKSNGLFRYVNKSSQKIYKKRTDELNKIANRSNFNLGQRIIMTEELFTEAPYCEMHQRKIMESDLVKTLNPYYVKDFILSCFNLPQKNRSEGEYNKVLLYKLAKINGVPEEVLNKPKKGLSYGHKDFIEKKLHLPEWKEILQNETLRRFIDMDLIYEKERDNFFAFDRLRSLHYYIIHVLKI